MGSIGRVSPAFLLLLASTAVAADRHPLSTADLGRLRGVGSPQVSPDGRWVVFSLSTTDYDANDSTREIMLLSTDTNRVRRLVEGASPQWSPDGRFIAYRGTKEDTDADGDKETDEQASDSQSGLWLYDLTNDSNRFLVRIHSTDHFLGHGARKNFIWSHDGKHIAYVGAEPAIESDKEEPDVLVFRRILYKTRTSFSDNRRTHVWIVAVAGGEPRLLTPGRFDEHSITFSPDDRHIAFASNRSDDPDNNYTDDLWTLDVATEQVQRLTHSSGTVFQPSWSPDGRQIAFLATVRAVNTKDSPPEDRRLYVMDRAGGTPRNLTGALDRRVGGFTWHPRGRAIYFSAGDRGRSPLFRVTLASGEIDRMLDGEHRVGGYSVDAHARVMAFTKTSVTEPGELWLADADGRNPRRVTSYNDDFLQRVALQPAETIWFDSFDGTPIQGWVMKPAGFTPGRKHPTVLWVHGGPHGMYGYAFSSRMQLLAANGYGVIYLNPRGSTGYGQAFSDGCVMNWGGGDYKDLMAGVDFAAARYDWIDADRLGVIGGSYGGFMTNWIVTQTHRFKAAVSVASVSNLISFYGTSLYHLLIEVEFNGKPWDNYPLLWQWSPLAHIRNVKTPTLLLHGENDHDVPFTQAEEMYIALKKLGVDSELVRYPGEGHGFRKPRHRIDYLHRTIEWFDRYLKE